MVLKFHLKLYWVVKNAFKQNLHVLYNISSGKKWPHVLLSHILHMNNQIFMCMFWLSFKAYYICINDWSFLEICLKNTKYHAFQLIHQNYLLSIKTQIFLSLLSLVEICSLILRRHHCRWRAAFDLCSALMAIEQWGFFNVPNPLRHGPTVYYLRTRDTHI